MKRQLKIVSNIVKNTTCFAEHEKQKICCEKKSCENWISLQKTQNCSVILAKRGPTSIKQMSDILEISRAQLSQIKKEAIEKLIKNF